MPRRFALLSALVPTLLLAGCAGEPSEAVMEKAMTKLVQDGLEQARQTIMALAPAKANEIKPFTGFESFSKTGPCSQPNSGEAVYVCEFTYTGSINGAHETATARARFYQTAQGWQAEMTD